MKRSILGLMLIFGLSQSHHQDTESSSPYYKTLIGQTCNDNISTLLDPRDNQTSHFLYTLCVNASITVISNVSTKLVNKEILPKALQENAALENCREFLSLALYNLNMSHPTKADALTTPDTQANFRTWLSAAIADVGTCIEGFQPNGTRKFVQDLDNSTKLITASLTILNKINNYTMSSPDNVIIGQQADDLETIWLSTNGVVLQDGSQKKLNPNVTVAADGSGNYRTINEALSVAPSQSDQRFVIYVKKGMYEEIVKVKRDQWNVMVYGDGIGNTIVSGSLHVEEGGITPVAQTATFSAFGQGFIAMNMEFRNTYTKSQAVALFSSSDQSVFYRCRMFGYQDTLYAHSQRQFYRDCQILGTTDFIFGDAAAVFQNSDILVRHPVGGYPCITAQGKDNPETNTGFAIHNCTIAAAENLGGTKAYLGRPWKNFSTTIYMESNLGDIVDPHGWISLVPGAAPPDTIFYIEYDNRGPGAVATGRVQWRELRRRNTRKIASKFTVRSFINGDVWLPATGVPFQLDL